MKSDHHFGKLLSSLILCLIPGYAALYVYTESIPGWFSLLNKPGFLPSYTIIFYGIIVLFCLFGLALYAIWMKGVGNSDVSAAFWWFLFSISLLFLWFFIFFYLQVVFFALALIILIDAAVLCTCVLILRSSITPVFFLLPCFIALLIVSYINAQILFMNPDLHTWGVML